MSTTKITRKQREIAFTEVYLKAFNQIWIKHKVVVPIKLHPERVAHHALIILEFTQPEIKKHKIYVATKCTKEMEQARQRAYKMELQKRRVHKTSTNKAYILNVIKVTIKKFKTLNKGKKFTESNWYCIMKNVELYICSPNDKWHDVISMYLTYNQLKDFCISILKDVQDEHQQLQSQKYKVKN
jgi:hypothetical protein